VQPDEQGAAVMGLRSALKSWAERRFGIEIRRLPHYRFISRICKCGHDATLHAGNNGPGSMRPASDGAPGPVPPWGSWSNSWWRCASCECSQFETRGYE
jgi:hypothetical protein